MLSRAEVIMGFLLNKRGQALATDETIKWIIYIAVLAAAILGVWQIASKVFG